MHYMHVIGYGKGYATVSLTPFSPVLILIVPLFIILKKNKINNFRLFYLIFLIIALLSYSLVERFQIIFWHSFQSTF